MCRLLDDSLISLYGKYNSIGIFHYSNDGITLILEIKSALRRTLLCLQSELMHKLKILSWLYFHYLWTGDEGNFVITQQLSGNCHCRNSAYIILTFWFFFFRIFSDYMIPYLYSNCYYKTLEHIFSIRFQQHRENGVNLATTVKPV